MKEGSVLFVSSASTLPFLSGGSSRLAGLFGGHMGIALRDLCSVRCRGVE